MHRRRSIRRDHEGSWANGFVLRGRNVGRVHDHLSGMQLRSRSSASHGSSCSGNCSESQTAVRCLSLQRVFSVRPGSGNASWREQPLPELGPWPSAFGPDVLLPALRTGVDRHSVQIHARGCRHSP